MEEWIHIFFINWLTPFNTNRELDASHMTIIYANLTRYFFEHTLSNNLFMLNKPNISERNTCRDPMRCEHKRYLTFLYIIYHIMYFIMNRTFWKKKSIRVFIYVTVTVRYYHMQEICVMYIHYNFIIHQYLW